jgi:hypothetical protein
MPEMLWIYDSSFPVIPAKGLSNQALCFSRHSTGNERLQQLAERFLR